LLEPGQIFAHRYRVSRRIAEGGMGAIFEAEHTATERKVALKLLFPHIMSVASARKKFELEAKISARVNNRNIVEVLDAGFDEATQSPFLVMELLDGQTLAQHVREHGPFDADQALPLLEQIAAGLDAAHGYREPNGSQKPIVHRDLKPENLFLARDHGMFSVKILDFGIAKVLGETGNVSQEVRGTPLYMAFEQVTAAALSPQTDVWALGLISYYMFTGWHYWRSASQPSANVQSLFAEILSLPLEPPSVRMRQQNVSVQLPPGFDAWLLECIQRDPTRRFASAGAAVAALGRAFGKSMRPGPRLDSKPAPPPVFGATEAFEPPAPTPSEQTATAASLPGIASERASSHAPSAVLRHKPWIGAAAGVAALLLAGVGWLAFGRGDAPHARPSASMASSEAAASEPATLTSVSALTHAAPSTPLADPVPGAAAGAEPQLKAPAPAGPASAAAAAEGPAPLPSAPEPQVRVAPREESEPELAPVEAPAIAERLPASPGESAPPRAAAPSRTHPTTAGSPQPAIESSPPTVSPSLSPALTASPSPAEAAPAAPTSKPPVASPAERTIKSKNADAYRIR
jgi:serine/threonine protein kinase